MTPKLPPKLRLLEQWSRGVAEIAVAVRDHAALTDCGEYGGGVVRRRGHAA